MKYDYICEYICERDGERKYHLSNTINDEYLQLTDDETRKILKDKNVFGIEIRNDKIVIKDRLLSKTYRNEECWKLFTNWHRTLPKNIKIIQVPNMEFATCSAGGNNTTIYIFENGKIIAQHHGFNTIGTVCPNSYLELDSFVHKKIDGHDIIIIEWYEWDEYCNSNHTSIFCDGKLVYYNHPNRKINSKLAHAKRYNETLKETQIPIEESWREHGECDEPDSDYSFYYYINLEDII